MSRRYTDSAGNITSCQIGVFAAYMSRHGHASVNRALYKGYDRANPLAAL